MGASSGGEDQSMDANTRIGDEAGGPQFGKNATTSDALAASNQVLGKAIEAQKAKIDTLKAGSVNSASSFGENDACMKNWQIQLNNA